MTAGPLLLCTLRQDLKVEARQIDTGRLAINRASHEPLAPFGGFKKSGISREFGSFGQDSGNLGGLP